MRFGHKKRALILAGLMLLSVVAGGVAFMGTSVAQNQGPPDDAGPSNAGPPENIQEFTSTKPIPDDQLVGNLTKDIFKDGNDTAIRVDEKYRSNTTIEVRNETVVNNNSTRTQLVFDVSINHSENVSVDNVTFYIQKDVVESAGEVDTLTLLINGSEKEFYVDEDAGPGNSPWVLLRASNFSTNTMTFKQTAPPDVGPMNGQPPGVDAFTNTTPLTANQTNPESLAGKIRVEKGHADNMTVNLTRNSSTAYELIMNYSGHAENVTIYINLKAMAASQNLDNLAAYVNGSQVAFGQSKHAGGTWVSFEVPSFSTKSVTFTSGGGSGDGLLGGLLGGNTLLAVGGLVGLLLFLGGGWILYKRSSRSGERKVVK